MSLDLLLMSQNTMNAYSDAIRLLSSNVQNFGVDGYKEVQYSFQSLFSQLVGGPSGNSTNISQTVSVLPTGLNFVQGSLKDGRPLNAAIRGTDLFIIQNPNNLKFTYKRNSDFIFDEKGYLIDVQGNRVMGYRFREDGVLDRTKLTPIKIDLNKYNPNDLGFDTGGIMINNYKARKDALNYDQAVLPNGNKLFQLALAKFSNPGRLALDNGTAYRETALSGPVRQIGVSSDTNMGEVFGAMTEVSTVNPADVTVQGIQLQRGYNFALSNMNMVNRVIQDFVSKIGS